MIGYAGLSHLGLVSAVAAASKGFDVVGYDPDAALVAALDRGELPVTEPDLPELLAAARSRVTWSANPASLVRCDLIYVAVDVPIDDDGHSDLSPVGKLLDTVVAASAAGATLVILSQVNPGYTRGRVASIEARGRHLFYQVETLIFGRAVERALHPERHIVGCPDRISVLPDALARYLATFDCPVLSMRFESAELAKISINMFLTATVTTTNMLAEACEAVGADWSEIAPALKLDRRIGPHAYLKPGLGIGGTNLLRDMLTIKGIAASGGTDASQIDAWLVNSRWRRDWALRALHREVLARMAEPMIAVWGLAYKEHTASTRNSPGVALIDALPGYRRRAFDPAAAFERVGDATFTRAATALDACRDADALVIMTPWPELASIDPAATRATMRGDIVIDPFAVLAVDRCAAAGLRHLRLGAAARTETVGAC